MWRQAFVEASSDQWMGVHAGEARTLVLQLRGEGGVTQVALTVQDVEPDSLRHLLGHEPPFHPMHPLPLPTLTAPLGWRVQMQGGTGGEAERGERALLRLPEGKTADPATLLAHFAPQLERQEWRTLHVENEEGAVHLTARTARGVGVLTLGSGPDAGTWQAVLLHVALRPGGPGNSSFYTLSSQG